MSVVSVNNINHQSFFDLIKKYRIQLHDPNITISDIYRMTDNLFAELKKKENFGEIEKEIIDFFDDVKARENQRRNDDQSLLAFVNQLGFEIKNLKLQIDTLAPSIIEERLNDLYLWYLSLSEESGFQNKFFQKELYYLKSLLEDLTFRFHFPIVDVIERSIDQNILSYLRETQDYFFGRGNGLLFSQIDLKRYLEKKLSRPVKHLEEEANKHFLTQIILDYLQETIG